MISVQDLATQKARFAASPSSIGDDPAYDHVLQRSRLSLDIETFKISMKSDTMFDRERDPSDER